MIDEGLLKKLYIIQAKKIQETSVTVSFSSVLNEVLRKALK